MMFFLVVGNRYRTKSEGATEQAVRCPNCGTVGHFQRKSGRQYLTLFFLLPVLPLGGRSSFVECPKCHARFVPPEGAFASAA